MSSFFAAGEDLNYDVSLWNSIVTVAFHLVLIDRSGITPQEELPLKMIQSFACAALSATLLGAVPALAQTPDAMTGMNCSEASMKAMHDSMMKMTDPTKKAEVMKEMDIAKDMMAKKDEKGCMMQMEKAMGMMK